MISDIEYLFMCLLAVYPLWENAYQIHCPFLKGFFVVMKLCEFVIYFVYKHLIKYVICKYFSPIQYVAFAFC